MQAAWQRCPPMWACMLAPAPAQSTGSWPVCRLLFGVAASFEVVRLVFGCPARAESMHVVPPNAVALPVLD